MEGRGKGPGGSLSFVCSLIAPCGSRLALRAEMRQLLRFFAFFNNFKPRGLNKQRRAGKN